MGKINLLISLVFLLQILQSCSPYGNNVPSYGVRTGNFIGDSTDPNAMLSVNSLLILPVGFDESTRKQAANAELFYDALVNAFKSDLDMELKYDERLIKNFAASNSSACLEFARAKGGSYGSDAVLCTVLHGFIERKGSSVGTESPAALSFSIQALRISDGRSIWAGDFVFKDAALSENLFALQQHLAERAKSGGWQSAQSMLEKGFREASQDFAQRRLAKFAPGQF